MMYFLEVYNTPKFPEGGFQYILAGFDFVLWWLNYSPITLFRAHHKCMFSDHSRNNIKQRIWVTTWPAEFSTLSLSVNPGKAMLFFDNLENKINYTWVKLLRAVTTTYNVGKQQNFPLKYWIKKKKHEHKRHFFV